MTFAASANCAVYLGGTPVFADVEPDTLLLDAASVEARITSKTRAIIAVDYAGQPCDYAVLGRIAKEHGLALVDDASHSVGGSDHGRPVGSLADLNTFSFHPVKHLTTGEGGMVTTDDTHLAARMRIFRNHGITTDHRQRAERGSFFYEMVDLGYNYRITDFQCALGLSQLAKLPSFIRRRREIAARFDAAFLEVPAVRPLKVRDGASHAYHLYPVLLDTDQLASDRDTFLAALRGEGIGANVHYIPVHLHPFYRDRLGTGRGLCPVAEAAYERLITLPIFPRMADTDVEDVIAAIIKVAGRYAR
jgi:perosamine synthetase